MIGRLTTVLETALSAPFWDDRKALLKLIKAFLCRDAQIPVLPREQAGLAELHSPQPLAQRMFRQGGARRQEAWQGQLLDTGP